MRTVIVGFFALAISFAALGKTNDAAQKGKSGGHEQADQSAPTMLVINNEAAAPSSSREDAKNKEELDRQIAEYTGELADYTRLLAWITGVLAVLGVFQLWFLNRSDKTASKSADAAERAIIAANRAWIKVDFAPAGIKYDQNGANIAFTCYLTNVGQSPATYVDVQVEAVDLFTSERGHMDAQDAAERITKEVRERSVSPLQYTIFPGPRASVWPIEVTYPQALITKTKLFGILPTPALHPIIVGVVNYRIGFDDTVHVTCFAVQLSHRRVDRPFLTQKIPGLPLSSAGIWLEEGDVEAGDIEMRLAIFGNGMAD